MTPEESQRIVDEVTRKLKPIEDSFMAYVFAYQTIGYGRMMQLIQEHWNKCLEQERTAFVPEGDSKGRSQRVP